MKKVIFDIDGVLLSEKRYFDVSALVVWEWYHSPQYMHLDEEQVTADVTEEQITTLRARFWKNDEILSWLKSHGINSNWDMVHAHIVTTIWLLLEQYIREHGKVCALSLNTVEDVQKLGTMLRPYVIPTADDVEQRLLAVVPPTADKEAVFASLSQAMAETVGAAVREWVPLGGPLWQLHQRSFQHWYFGDSLYEKIYGETSYTKGKEGFLHKEEPLGTIAGIRYVFQELKRRGYEIAIASGRSQIEMQVPFETYGWLSEFDPFYISTDTDVAAAEEMLHMPLGKPNPFAYYLGAFGKEPSNYRAYTENPEAFKNGTYYVVGDSLSDVWCAKAMGAVMIGTLTGLEGREARTMFESEGADYIVDSVEHILDILPGDTTGKNV